MRKVIIKLIGIILQMNKELFSLDISDEAIQHYNPTKLNFSKCKPNFKSKI